MGEGKDGYMRETSRMTVSLVSLDVELPARVGVMHALTAVPFWTRTTARYKITHERVDGWTHKTSRQTSRLAPWGQAFQKCTNQFRQRCTLQGYVCQTPPNMPTNAAVRGVGCGGSIPTSTSTGRNSVGRGLINSCTAIRAAESESFLAEFPTPRSLQCSCATTAIRPDNTSPKNSSIRPKLPDSPHTLLPGP